jgi:hypothetical protein
MFICSKYKYIDEKKITLWIGNGKWIMRFGLWNVWGLYRAGSLKTVANELANSGSTRCQMG